MTIAFSCAVSHAPGMTAWANAAPEAQRDRLYAGFERLRDTLATSGAETLILLTSEHWANFFLDHIGAFCIGRAERYSGPIEPWLNIGKAEVQGDPELAQALLDSSYEAGIEPSFAYEMEFDHGTMVPLHFLAPRLSLAVVPIMFNTLAPPQPTARRCFEFGKLIGEVARRSPKRIGLVATGGLSHDPGERNHGLIDSDFDHRFLAAMAAGDAALLSAYRSADFAAAGAGAFELLSWVALAGAVAGAKGEILAYEAVKPWATGIGLMMFAAA
jgi:aromatic ring-opening dioxygenase catalytic subunit (LigB family)